MLNSVYNGLLAPLNDRDRTRAMQDLHFEFWAPDWRSRNQKMRLASLFFVMEQEVTVLSPFIESPSFNGAKRDPLTSKTERPFRNKKMSQVQNPKSKTHIVVMYNSEYKI